MTDRLVSLAAGCILDVDPVTAVDVAAAAGFGGVGIWFDPATFTPAVATQVRRRLDATGVVAVDIEPVLLAPSGDPGDALVDAAGEIGARFVLLGNRTQEHAAAVDRTAELCRRASAHGVTIAVEFLPPFKVNDLTSALAFAGQVGEPNCGVLVDTLHLARSGSTLDQLRAAPRSMFPYLQLADAPTTPTLEWLEEALHGRLLPGDGELPLVDVLRIVPDVPISVELRSRALMTGYPDPVERARAILQATERVVAAAG